jgi:hypothetical protein
MPLAQKRRVPTPSNRRLRSSLSLWVKIFRPIVGKLTITGTHHLQVPQHQKIIFAVTHITDFDVPVVAAALRKEFNLAITDLSVHKNIREAISAKDPTIVGLLVAGRKNFLPITYVQGKGVRTGHIDPQEILDIADSLMQGKSVVIAGHNPVIDGKLPDKSGYVAIRAAQLSGKHVVVIPVGVDVSWRKGISAIKIGAPLVFGNRKARAAGENIDRIYRESIIGVALSDENKATVRAARAVIHETEGLLLMQAFADLLPVERRGNW